MPRSRRKSSKRKCALREPASEDDETPPTIRRDYSVDNLLCHQLAAVRCGQLARLVGSRLLVLEVADGSVRECSEAFATALGLEPGTLCGERLSDWVVPAADGAADALARALATGEPFARRVAFRSPRAPAGAPACREGELHVPADGVRLGSAVDARLAFLVDGAAARDATAAELETAAAALLLQPSAAPQLRKTFAALRSTLVVTDPNQHDNPIVHASPAFCALTGYPLPELVGRNCRLLQGPATDCSKVKEVSRAVHHAHLADAALRQAQLADAAVHHAHLPGAARQQQPCSSRAGASPGPTRPVRPPQPCTAELLNYRRDGSAFLMLLHFAPLLDARGRLARFVGLQADTTALLTDRCALELHAAHLRAAHAAGGSLLGLGVGLAGAPAVADPDCDGYAEGESEAAAALPPAPSLAPAAAFVACRALDISGPPQPEAARARRGAGAARAAAVPPPTPPPRQSSVVAALGAAVDHALSQHLCEVLAASAQISSAADERRRSVAWDGSPKRALVRREPPGADGRLSLAALGQGRAAAAAEPTPELHHRQPQCAHKLLSSAQQQNYSPGGS